MKKPRDFSQRIGAGIYDKKWGYINEKGEKVIDFIFKDAEVFSGQWSSSC